MPADRTGSRAGRRMVEVYPAGDGWRWRKWAANGRIVAESGEAYTRKSDATEAASRENPDDLIEIVAP
jgi:Domain of unknown function (DUF1508)